jgi:hypothetical protein
LVIVALLAANATSAPLAFKARLLIRVAHQVAVRCGHGMRWERRDRRGGSIANLCSVVKDCFTQWHGTRRSQDPVFIPETQPEPDPN